MCYRLTTAAKNLNPKLLRPFLRPCFLHRESQRFAHWLEDQEMRRLIDGLSLGALNQSRKLELKEPLDLESYFLDTTCLKANIHFPVDWVLLRDGVRTLMKATELIRKARIRPRLSTRRIRILNVPWSKSILAITRAFLL